MVQMKCVIFFILLGVNYVQSIEWTEPRDRTVYGVNGQPLTLKWELEPASYQKFWAAEWQIAETVDSTTARTIVLVDNDLGIITDQLYATSSNFGEITIKALDSGFMNFIIATAKDEPLNVAKDVVTIKYIGEVATFKETNMETEYSINENTEAARTFNTSIVVQGDPLPSVFWTWNDKDAKDHGFTIVQTISQEGGTFFVNSTITKSLTPDDNGVLKVVIKHGQLGDDGPSQTKESILDLQYSPKDITFNHNITGGTMYDNGYVNLTCKGDSNPPATYVIEENEQVISRGDEHSIVRHIGNFHHKRSISYRCIANNSLGESSASLDIKLRNVTVLSKRIADEDTDWWVYFGTAVAIGLLIFIGFAILLCIHRRRVRSLNLRSDIDKMKMRTEYGDGRNGARSNGANHVYDMNERGLRGTATRTATQLPQIDQSKKRPEIPYPSESTRSASGQINDGFDLSVYDTIGK